MQNKPCLMTPEVLFFPLFIVGELLLGIVIGHMLRAIAFPYLFIVHVLYVGGCLWILFRYRARSWYRWVRTAIPAFVILYSVSCLACLWFYGMVTPVSLLRSFL